MIITSDSEKQLLDIYDKIKFFILTLINTHNPPDNSQINNYKTLRTDYGEFLDFYQPKNNKQKKLSELLDKFMKFTHFVVHIYKEDLTKLSGLLFNQILGTDFDKSEVINGFAN
ncbi:unnamed protein product [Cunninghamella echinulata]